MLYILRRMLQALRAIRGLIPYVNDAARATEIAAYFSTQLEEVADEIKKFRKPESHEGKQITRVEYEELVDSLINRVGLISMEIKSGKRKK